MRARLARGHRSAGWLAHMLRGCALATVLGASGCDQSVHAVTLELSAGTCDAAQLSEIRMLSVEVYGFDAAGDFCTLQKRCVSEVEVAPGAADPIGDLAEALRAQRQPLVDTDRGGAAYIALVGRRYDDCFVADAHPMCALADLANAQDGTLDIELECGACVAHDQEYCP